ncbi:carboxylesterase family protein [Sphingomonas sp. C8-2]|jgi:para-nitrobenzyl esterase|nr:carboxylesterase family protein [Sphingomonas sp. C8-2]
MEAPVVSTVHGRVRGLSVSADIWGYHGIPYAAPPVGPLRWRPPQPAAGWTGIREGVAFGPDPIQPPGARTSRAPGMAEDCLYLNVWAPKEHRAGGWPVLIWSCGGAFTTGGGAFAEEDPARLAAKGAVVVSFNVRLNIFGFLAHPALSAESPQGSSGNYGLMDQAAAFRWIRENIEAFNGDSRRMTFFGESAGATMALLLLASPLLDRPYDRAIFQSPGSFGDLLPLAAAEEHGAALGGSVEEMRAIPADELLDRLKRLPAVRPSLWLARPIRPIADGWLIRSTMPFAEDFDAVPAIIGVNEDEGAFFGPRMGVRTLDDYRAFVSGIFGENSEEALAYYPATDEGQVGAMFAAVYGDRGFLYPIDRLARAFVRQGADVHRYVYAYRHGETRRPPTHSDEIGVLMDRLPHVRPQDADMADILARSWIAFAETGDPNCHGLPDWPRYDPATDRYLRLDVPPSVGAGWRADAIDFVARKSVDRSVSGR